MWCVCKQQHDNCVVLASERSTQAFSLHTPSATHAKRKWFRALRFCTPFRERMCSPICTRCLFLHAAKANTAATNAELLRLFFSFMWLRQCLALAHLALEQLTHNARVRTRAHARACTVGGALLAPCVLLSRRPEAWHDCL